MALLPTGDRPVTRLAPPDDMDAVAAATFRRITASCDASHFVAADMEILRSYVQAAVQADEAYKHMRKHGHVVGGKPSPLLAVRRTGEFIGEMSLLDQAPRSASVRALRESRL